MSARNRKLPPLGWIRAFEAAARHMNFTSAADEVGLTQAAISKQIKLLEQYFREPLFIRHARSVELTKVGAAYLPKVRDALQRLENSTVEVFGMRRAEILTVRCAIAFSVLWLNQRLPAYLKEHPEMPVRIISSIWNDDPNPQSYDLDIQYGSDRWPGYESDRLTHEWLSPVCHPDLLKGKDGLRELDDLQNFKLIHVMGYEEGWGRWLQSLKLQHIDSGKGYHVDNSPLAYELAEQKAGIALARKSLANELINSGKLVEPFSHRVDIDEGFHLLSPRVGKGKIGIHPHAANFREWILHEAVKFQNEAKG
ncbi:MAG: LysR family transcriptional regulator [Pseudomonadota bacterium]